MFNHMKEFLQSHMNNFKLLLQNDCLFGDDDCRTPLEDRASPRYEPEYKVRGKCILREIQAIKRHEIKDPEYLEKNDIKCTEEEDRDNREEINHEGTEKKDAEDIEKRDPEDVGKRDPEDTNRDPENTDTRDLKDTDKKDPEDTDKKDPEDTDKKDSGDTNQKDPEDTDKKDSGDTNKKDPEDTDKKEYEDTDKKDPEDTEKKDLEEIAKKDAEGMAKKDSEYNERIPSYKSYNDDKGCENQDSAKFLETMIPYRPEQKFAGDEYERALEYIRRSREDPNYKTQEIEKFLERMSRLREDLDYEEEKNERSRQTMAQKQQGPKLADNRYEKNVNYIKRLRDDPEYKEKEIERLLDRVGQHRDSKTYLEQKRERRIEDMKQFRQDTKFGENRYERNPEYGRRFHENPELRPNEIEKALQKASLLRDNLMYAEEENEKRIQRMKRLHQNTNLEEGDENLEHTTRPRQFPAIRLSEIERTLGSVGHLRENIKSVEQDNARFLENIRNIRHDTKFSEAGDETSESTTTRSRGFPGTSTNSTERSLESESLLRDNLRYVEHENERRPQNMRRLRQHTNLGEEGEEKKQGHATRSRVGPGIRSKEIEKTLESVSRLREYLKYADEENERCLERMRRLNQDTRQGDERDLEYATRPLQDPDRSNVTAKTLEGEGHFYENFRNSDHDSGGCPLSMRIQNLGKTVRFDEREVGRRFEHMRRPREDNVFREKEVQRTLECVNRLREYLKFAEEENERCLENMRRLRQVIKFADEGVVRNVGHAVSEHRRNGSGRSPESLSRLREYLKYAEEENERCVEKLRRQQHDPKRFEERIERCLENMRRQHQDPRCSEERIDRTHEYARYPRDDPGQRRKDFERIVVNGSRHSNDPFHSEQKNGPCAENMKSHFQDPKYYERVERSHEYASCPREDPEPRRKEVGGTFGYRGRLYDDEEKLDSDQESERYHEIMKRLRWDLKCVEDGINCNKEIVRNPRDDPEYRRKDIGRTITNMSRLCDDLLQADQKNETCLENMKRHYQDPMYSGVMEKNRDYMKHPRGYPEYKGPEIEEFLVNVSRFHENLKYPEEGDENRSRHRRNPNESDESNLEDIWVPREDPVHRRTEIGRTLQNLGRLSDNLDFAEEENARCLEAMRRLRQELLVSEGDENNLSAMNRPYGNLTYEEQEEANSLEKIDFFLRVRRTHEKK